jgi:Fe2+ or Zn2+ uptake regulation protein
MRQTKQKEILEEKLKTKKTFFTAEEFHNVLKEQKIGIATVYRFLNEKVQKNELHSYQCKRRTLFSLEKKTHAHFSCEVCKTTKHIELKNIDFVENEISGEVCHFQLDVTGICEKCLKRKI